MQSGGEPNLERDIFYLGAKWCGPCRKAHPKYRDFADNYSEDFNVKFWYIDVDNPKLNNDLLKEEVERSPSIPALLLFLEGKFVQRLSGWDEDKLYNAMHEYYIVGEEIDTSEIAQLKHAPMEYILPYSSDSSEEHSELELELEVCEGPECSIIESKQTDI